MQIIPCLIGLADIIRDYPGVGDWWLGLLLIDPDYRGKGLGRQVYTAYESWAAKQGAQRIYLGVIEENHTAHRFWQGLGFKEIKRRPPTRFGDREHIVIVMMKAVNRLWMKDWLVTSAQSL